MTDQEPSGSCILQPCHRSPLPEDEPVCLPHRSKVAGQLRDIPALVVELRGEPAADVTTGEERIEERADHLVELAGSVAAVVRVEHLHLVDVHAGAVPGQSGAPRVHGSREAPMPISADRTDLLAPADGRTVHDGHMVPMVRATGEKEWVMALFGGKEVWQEVRRREVVRDERGRVVMVPAGDQTGHASAATILDGWCRDFAETRRESVPEPTPTAQCRYLADRLDWAFTDHPAVDEFAGEVGDLWHTLRRAAGLTTPQPELCVGVPCRRADCDVKTLWRIPGSDYVECGSCGALLTETEYQAWCKLLAAAARGRKTA